MEDKLHCIMEYYSEALEEMMGAQGYANRAYHATAPDVRAEYVRMSRQELEHAESLKKLAHMKAKDDAMLMTVWNKHQEHLDRWKDSVMEKLKKAESKLM